jgi:glutaredoxin
MKNDVTFLAGHKLEVFTATWCPDCRRLDRWLAENEVLHDKIDIDKVDGAAETIEEATGKRGVPFFRIDGTHWVRGYHKELPSRFDARILVDELRSSVS